MDVDEQYEYQPFSFFGKTFTFERSEQKIIKVLRKWIPNTFSAKQVLSNEYITKLSDVPRDGAKNEKGYFKEFDL